MSRGSTKEAEEEKYEKNLDDSIYARRVDNVVRRSTLRLGVSGMGLNQLGDEKNANSYFGDKALAGYIDIFGPGRNDIFSSGIGFIFRHMEMKDRHDLAGVGVLDILGFNVAMRFFLLHFDFLWSIWSPYIIIDTRIVYVESTTISTGPDKKLGSLASFASLGVSARAGVQWSIAETFGFYAEALYGYTPVGKRETNIDGLQIVAGMLLRFK
ncbi:MAG TPA: hypothetical protein PLY93_13520 [Turneriella sp.]|nr:hypothetical protein [Turneriella sp.]